MKFLSRTIDKNGEGRHTNELTESDATLTLVVECFHMEQQSRELSRLNKQGHVKYYREFFRKAIVTWKGFKKIEFKNTADHSSPPNIGETLHRASNGMTRLNINSEIVFADSETEQEYQKIRDGFITSNRFRDRDIRCYVSGNLSGLQKEWLYLGNNDRPPIWVSKRVYIACTLLWLSWPYRILFSIATSKVEFTLKKSVSNVVTPTVLV